MAKGIRRHWLIGCMVVFQGAFAAADAEAGPILDWLFQTHTANYPAMPVAGVVGNACDPCAPQVSQQTTVHYVPQTLYRTTWARVPVTSYRPITNVDPCTGCPVTCMKPCTSYTWQAQRVPYTTHRPFCSTVMTAKPCMTTCNSCSTPAQTVVGSPIVSPGCSSCGNPSHGHSTPSYSYSAPTYGAADPYYGMSGTAVPSTSSPTSPMTIPTSPTPAPLNAAPMNAAPVFPADQQPNLDPAGLQNGFQDEFQNGFQNGLQGSNTRTFNHSPREIQPASRNPSPTNGQLFSTPRSSNAITPVPDPDAQLDGIQPIEPAPQLLDPRDKTAANPARREWTYSPIKISRQIDTTPVATTPRMKSSPDEKWDSSGWHSVKN